ncbi:Zinc finger transcription factor [Parasponia andersonii]|uniref:RING-type E3 ubiquitin transferase n=1 Tax=Parasponia andersonii TaxID=3476 RepID=A0A2P5CMI2_PARAD|nr:Zinc finger transcription factor [Parasponia andersonii]
MLRARVLVKFQPLNLPKNRLSIIILHFILFFFDNVKAQNVSPDFPSTDETNFQPSLAVVIGILSVMFVITFFLLAYAKFCHRTESAENLNHHQNQTGLISSSNRFSGIDKSVIESLPFFRFSALKGSKEGLECAVCLSKFEDIEVLRLLPKCKHAFHINCIDYWLEKHSSCPLCRQRVSSEDLNLITYSSSMRFLWNNHSCSNNQSELRQDSNIELFVQREESRRGSSRFSIGSSFRKIEKGTDDDHDHRKEEEVLIQNHDGDDQRKVFHKHNHKIAVSDFVFKNRWSNVSSSDLIFLNSEMLNDMSSRRFVSPMDSNQEVSLTVKTEENDEIVKIKEEMEIKRSFENKVGTINNNFTCSTSNQVNKMTSSSVMRSGEQRSVSEITAISRYGDLGAKNKLRRESSLNENNVKEERIRRVWLTISKRTVQWFANREKRSQESQNQQPQRLDI